MYVYFLFMIWVNVDHLKIKMYTTICFPNYFLTSLTKKFTWISLFQLVVPESGMLIHKYAFLLLSQIIFLFCISYNWLHIVSEKRFDSEVTKNCVSLVVVAIELVKTWYLNPDIIFFISLIIIGLLKYWGKL